MVQMTKHEIELFKELKNKIKDCENNDTLYLSMYDDRCMSCMKNTFNHIYNVIDDMIGEE